MESVVVWSSCLVGVSLAGFVAIRRVQVRRTIGRLVDEIRGGHLERLGELVDSPDLLPGPGWEPTFVFTCAFNRSNVPTAIVVIGPGAVYLADFQPTPLKGRLRSYSLDQGSTFEARVNAVGFRSLREHRSGLILRPSGPDFDRAVAAVVRAGLMGPPT